MMIRASLRLLATTCAEVNSFGQDIPLVYDVEHTGASFPSRCLPAFENLPIVRPSATIPSSGPTEVDAPPSSAIGVAAAPRSRRKSSITESEKSRLARKTLPPVTPMARSP